MHIPGFFTVAVIAIVIVVIAIVPCRTLGSRGIPPFYNCSKRVVFGQMRRRRLPVVEPGIESSIDHVAQRLMGVVPSSHIQLDVLPVSIRILTSPLPLHSSRKVKNKVCKSKRRQDVASSVMAKKLEDSPMS